MVQISLEALGRQVIRRFRNGDGCTVEHLEREHIAPCDMEKTTISPSEGACSFLEVKTRRTNRWDLVPSSSSIARKKTYCGSTFRRRQRQKEGGRRATARKAKLERKYENTRSKKSLGPSRWVKDPCKQRQNVRVIDRAIGIEFLHA